MFQRVLYDHWTSIVPIVAFILTFSVFLIGSIRALTTSKEIVAHNAQLPLDPPSSSATSQPPQESHS